VVYCSIMPRVPIDYSKTIIYRIVCKDPTIKDCYVGSTTDFKSRKSGHNTTCNNIKNKDYNMNVYQFIRDKGGWNNWDMIEIEKYNAVDKLDQLKRERFWLEYYKATLNKNVPSRTGNEWCEEHRDDILVKKKIYYQEHKYEIYDYQKEYNKEHRDEKKKYNTIYYEKYYEENKDEINRKKREKRHQTKELKLMGLEDKY
jgi:hypothetical protein